MGDSWVLGICDGHDAGAALVDQDGRLAFAVSEERLSRRKHQPGFPARAIAAAMEERLSRGGRLDAVAVAERAGRWPFRRFDSWYRGTSSSHGPLRNRSRLAAAWQLAAARWFPGPSEAASRAVLKERLLELEIRAPLVLLDHHDCHAWSAAAGGADALVVTMDAFGDGVAGGIYRLEGDAERPRLRRCRRIPAPHGAAIVYGATTQLLGFDEGDEGKVVARAAHGDPDRLRPIFASVLEVRDGLPHLRGRDPLLRLARALQDESAEDIAAALQAHIEDVVAQVIGGAHHDFGGRQLRLAGGLFANVTLNRRLADDALAAGLTDVFVFPAMGDAGLCAGAALMQRAALGGPARGIEDARIGPLAWDESAPIPMRVPPVPIEVDRDKAREALLAGGIVARCTRRTEFGPRALCARSLLFVPDDPVRGRHLNANLQRDWMMPFGPVLPVEEAPRLLDGWGPGVAPLTRYMTVALPATKALQQVAPAAVHLDGTARAQVVSHEDDPALHDLLMSLPDKVLVNTSLNLHGEPIACTLEQAAATAARAGAELLWVG